LGWDSSGNYHDTEWDFDRAAFLFNLTSGMLQRQKLGWTSGRFQTYNSLSYGPTFGQKFDLYVGSDLRSGHAYHLSFGPNGEGYADSICGDGQGSELTFGRVEIFSASSAALATAAPPPAAGSAASGDTSNSPSHPTRRQKLGRNAETARPGSDAPTPSSSSPS
jgi:hypothetical protein